MNQVPDQQYLSCLDSMFEQSSKLEALAKPLYKYFGINYCSYLLLYKSGHSLALTSKKKLHEQITEHYVGNNKRSPIVNYFNIFPKSGFYMMDAETNIQQQRDPVFDELFAANDHYHQLVSISQVQTKRGEAILATAYLAPLARNDINNFYLNNLDLMHRINGYFSKELENIINNTPLIPPVRCERDTAQKLFINCHSHDSTPIRRFVKEAKLHYPKYNSLADITLNQREKEIIHWYLRGKSNTETAAILNLSSYTVASYFDRLKKKLVCYYKPQLLLKLIDGGIISQDDWKDIY